MYLHLGQWAVVRRSDVIGIFDLDNTTSSRATRDFLGRAEREGRVSSATEDLPKSFVLYGPVRDRYEICLSQLTTATLRGRAESESME